MYWGYLLAILISLILVKLASTVLTRNAQAKKAQQLGCLKPVLAKNRLPFGIDIMMRLAAAAKIKKFPQAVRNRFDELGTTTYQYYFLGAYRIATRDPENIKALLATNFDDFNISGLRRKALSPLIGDCIFTANDAF
jgi:hypothetical protein